jgi:hypothetical protein
MIDFLLDSKQAVERARTHTGRLESEELERLAKRYTEVLAHGRAENRLPAVPHPAGQRGRPAQTPAQNLLDRLEQHRPAVLAFMYDFEGLRTHTSGRRNSGGQKKRTTRSSQDGLSSYVDSHSHAGYTLPDAPCVRTFTSRPNSVVRRSVDVVRATTSRIISAALLACLLSFWAAPGTGVAGPGSKDLARCPHAVAPAGLLPGVLSMPAVKLVLRELEEHCLVVTDESIVYCSPHGTHVVFLPIRPAGSSAPVCFVSVGVENRVVTTMVASGTGIQSTVVGPAGRLTRDLDMDSLALGTLSSGPCPCQSLQCGIFFALVCYGGGLIYPPMTFWCAAGAAIFCAYCWHWFPCNCGSGGGGGGSPGPPRVYGGGWPELAADSMAGSCSIAGPGCGAWVLRSADRPRYLGSDAVRRSGPKE